MKLTEKRQSLTIKARTLGLTALYWSIVYYYSNYTKKKVSETLRAMLLFFISNDEKFDPERFWTTGVMAAYESFDGDGQMQTEVIVESARWLASKHKWKASDKHLKTLPVAIRKEMVSSGFHR